MKMKKIIKIIAIISIVLVIVWGPCEITSVNGASFLSMGISLKENGEVVATDDNSETPLLEKTLNGSTKIEKKYNEEISVYNSGAMDAYVRIRIYKYWRDNDGNKLTDLSPDLIELNVLEGNGWFVDEDTSTSERTIAYYSNILDSGKSTPNVTDYLKISNDVYNNYTVENNNGNIIVKNNYFGCSFCITVEVDAVQASHNAVDAIKGAWGVTVNIDSDGTLTLK